MNGDVYKRQDESLANEITEYLQKEIIMDFAGYEERSYSERFTREDGSFIDIAACARKDAPGIVAIYYYTYPEFARNYTLTIQGLLNGYSIQKDGTIIVADDGICLLYTSLTAVVSGVLAATAVLSGCGQSKKEVSINDDHLTAVSYTHLDVYKRQIFMMPSA